MQGAGFAAARGILTSVGHHRVELILVGLMRLHPSVVVRMAFKKMIGQFHMIESPMRAGAAERCHPIFEKIFRRTKPGFKVCFTQQARLVAVCLQMMRDSGLVFRQTDPVHPNAMGCDMLPGHDGCASRHAHHVLVVRALVVNAVVGQLINIGGSCDGAAIAAKRIEAHLICRDE